jgi:SWI/SNF related-matrix-associated actin-dependent regulator of chromatin subfamily C
MTRLVGAAVNLTLQKFELKLAQFAEMEEIVQAERRDLEKARQQLFLDRLAFKKRVREFEDVMRSASHKEPQEAMRMMQEAVGTGTGKKFAFQPANGPATNGVGPLSAEGGDFKSIDI